MTERFEWALLGAGETLEGAAVRLRGLRVEDCTETYAAWLNDPEVNRFLEVGHSTEDVATISAYVRAVAASPPDSLLAVVDAGSDQHIGNIKISAVDQRNRNAQVGYFIGDRSAWGRGFATEAVTLAVAAAIERLDLRRLEAGAHAQNVASQRVLEGAGFALEGRQRARLRLDDGWDDHLLYGLLADEWLARDRS